MQATPSQPAPSGTPAKRSRPPESSQGSLLDQHHLMDVSGEPFANSKALVSTLGSVTDRLSAIPRESLHDHRGSLTSALIIRSANYWAVVDNGLHRVTNPL
jgi:hypothetical protein